MIKVWLYSIASFFSLGVLLAAQHFVWISRTAPTREITSPKYLCSNQFTRSLSKWVHTAASQRIERLCPNVSTIALRIAPNAVWIASKMPKPRTNTDSRSRSWATNAWSTAS